MRVRSIVDGQLCLARVEVVEESAECILWHDFQAAMESHPDVLAILKVGAAGRNCLMDDEVAQPLWDKDCVRVSFHGPCVTFPCPLLFDVLPNVQEEK